MFTRAIIAQEIKIYEELILKNKEKEANKRIIKLAKSINQDPNISE